MFGPSASAFSASAALLTVLLLAGCSDHDVELPKVFGGNEVPPDVYQEPRVVPSPPAAIDRTTWPRLGDVPSRPKDFTPQPIINAAKSEMEIDRDDARQAQQAYQAAPPVVSSLAPPAPQPQP